MKSAILGTVLIIAALVAGKALFCQSSKKGEHSVTVEQAQSLIASDTTVIVLDVRTPEEYTGELGHIEKSLLLPVQELEQRIRELETYKSTTILAVCRSGRRSDTAARILKKHGYKAINVEGGMIEWNEKKLPVTH